MSQEQGQIQPDQAAENEGQNQEQQQNAEKVPQKTQEQLAEEKRIQQEQRKAQQEQRKRIEEQAKAKQEEDIKKLQQALKGALSGLGKTHDNRTMAYLKLNLAEKELQRIFEIQLRPYQQIRYLDLSSNALINVDVIADQFEHLLSLNVSKNQIGSLEAFNQQEKLLELQILDISVNKLTTIICVEVPSLRRLNLTENQIKTVDWKGHNGIEILQLRKNKLRKLKNISNMKNLRQLYVDQNELTDIRGLENLPVLKKLHLRSNKIKQFFNPFPYLPSLNALNLRENQFTSLDPFARIPVHIKQINFIANPVTEQLGQNDKKEFIWKFPHFIKVNKSQVTTQDRIEFQKEWKEKEEEREKERLEKMAQQQQARREEEEQARRKAAEQAQEKAAKQEEERAAKQQQAQQEAES